MSQPQEAAADPGREMSLLDHLEELRVRLVRVLIAAGVGFAICFAFAEKILEIMLRPLKEVLPASSTIQTTALTEGFFVSMKAAFVAGLFLASPVIFYQIWSFVAPGLYEEERRLAIPVAIFTALCFISGAGFGYYVVFPFGFTFLANYASDIVTLNPKLSEYYSLALGLLFAFGIIFEMPVFIFFLARFGVVDHIWLRQKRRWAIVIFFVVAAVLTPTPDAVNQILMAAPMVVLYEISIWVAYFFGKKKPKPEEGGDLPVPTDGGDDGGNGPDGAAPAGSDAALDDARISEIPPAEGAASLAGSDALQADAHASSPEGVSPADATTGDSGDSGTPGEPEAPRDAHEAEREAHDTAALGHDDAQPVAAKPEASSASESEAVKPGAPVDETPATAAKPEAKKD
uniref:twin-arginine translocase subunit TatC n=1 Tax=Fundidesulfovibrio putealis TaxID=270496 RepID=UPI000424B7E3|nr:twin-arginine translocase subunit TatC [Fundidesulfovibrio putealis]